MTKFDIKQFLTWSAVPVFIGLVVACTTTLSPQRPVPLPASPLVHNELNADPTSGWKRYLSEPLHISISYPEGWILGEYPTEGGVYLAISERSASLNTDGHQDGALFQVRINRQPSLSAASATVIVQEWVEALDPQNPDLFHDPTGSLETRNYTTGHGLQGLRGSVHSSIVVQEVFAFIDQDGTALGGTIELLAFRPVTTVEETKYKVLFSQLIDTLVLKAEDF